MLRKMLVVVLALVVVAAACDTTPKRGSASDMLPNLPDYQVVEGKTITEYISSLTEGPSLLSGNPLIAAAIEFAEGVITCYQNIGAVAVRIYSNKTAPLSSGLVAIVDRNAITNFGNLTQCLSDSDPFAAQSVVQVCSHTYTLKKDDNEFYIAYLGTNGDVCQAFCSNLEGCTASQP